jgi:hypothetical protein
MEPNPSKDRAMHEGKFSGPQLGPIFSKLRRCKNKRRSFVCIKIGKVTIEQSAQQDSTSEVKLIYDVFALL